MTTLDTPCIGICSTVYGDNVCRGCKRFFDEIIVWNAKDDIEKQVIFDRLNDLIVEVTKDVITIMDVNLLKRSIKALKIRHREEQNPLCWAYYILREVNQEITELSQYGFSVNRPHPNPPPRVRKGGDNNIENPPPQAGEGRVGGIDSRSVFKLIDEKLFELSQQLYKVKK